jgi:hypothetical protein
VYGRSLKKISWCHPTRRRKAELLILFKSGLELWKDAHVKSPWRKIQAA